MNLRSEKGLSGVDMTVGIIIFMIGSVVIFNMYASIFSLSSKLKVNESIVGYITEICEQIDYENYEDVDEARVRQIIEGANIPDGYSVSVKMKTYKQFLIEQIGTDGGIEDLVKTFTFTISYSINGQNRNFTVDKTKVKELEPNTDPESGSEP